MSFPGELDRQHHQQYGTMYPTNANPDESAARNLAQKGPFDPDSE